MGQNVFWPRGRHLALLLAVRIHRMSLWKYIEHQMLLKWPLHAGNFPFPVCWLVLPTTHFGGHFPVNRILASRRRGNIPVVHVDFG